MSNLRKRNSSLNGRPTGRLSLGSTQTQSSALKRKPSIKSKPDWDVSCLKIFF